MPGACCTRDLVCKSGVRCAHEHTGTAEARRHPLRNGLTANTACRMGGAKRYPSIAASDGDGFRFALPILRNRLRQQRLKRRATSTRREVRRPRSRPAKLFGEQDHEPPRSSEGSASNRARCLWRRQGKWLSRTVERPTSARLPEFAPADAIRARSEAARSSQAPGRGGRGASPCRPTDQTVAPREADRS
jgi:hypothetical protein